MNDEEVLNLRLGQIYKRIQAIADEEARSALVNGWAAQGNLMPEKLRLIEEADRILDDLMKPFGDKD